MQQQIICPGIITGTATPWLEFASAGERQFWKRGTLHSFDGQAARNFVYLVSGMLAINFYETTGRWRCQLFCAANSLANESNLITPLSIQKSIYLCNDACEVVYFNGPEVLEKLLHHQPHLLMNLAASQAVKSMHAQALLNALTMRNNLQQICWYITRLRLYHGKSNSFAPLISQQQLASLLGINERTFKRHIINLKEDGVLDVFTRKRIVISAPQRLEALAMPTDI